MYYSKRLRFRAPERSDIPVFVKWFTDPDVTRGITIPYPMGIEDENRWFDNMVQQPPEMHPFVMEIKDGDTWRMIGDCGFHQLDWRSRSAEIGIFIGEKESWSKGIGTEAMQMMLKVGFEVMDMHRVWLRVFSTNTRAVHCYEKAGFKHEGCMREAEFQDGKHIDVMLMSVLRTEWETIKQDQ